MKNRVYHPQIFQRRTGYITHGYFNEEPGISPPDMSKKNRVCHPRMCQRKVGYVTPGYVKEESGRQPSKKQIDKETTLGKTFNGRQPGKKQTDKEKTLDKNNG